MGPEPERDNELRLGPRQDRAGRYDPLRDGPPATPTPTSAAAIGAAVGYTTSAAPSGGERSSAARAAATDGVAVRCHGGRFDRRVVPAAPGRPADG